MRTEAVTIEEELADLNGEARTLLSATADAPEVKIVEARRRLITALEENAAVWSELRARLARAAQMQDRTIRRDFYKTLGLAFGVGALMAFHLGGRHS
jgi:ElaB/YqjD/DUF883 family membrane-anchored ribosome-binding protein